LSILFYQDQDQGQDFYFQDQDQDFIFCPRGASRPRLWSRGLHHCNPIPSIWSRPLLLPFTTFHSLPFICKLPMSKTI